MTGLRQRLRDAAAAVSLLGPTGAWRHASVRRVAATARAVVRAGVGLGALVPAYAAQRPDDDALVGADGTRWSWRDLERDTRRLGLAVHALGGVAGARVALLVRNRPELVIAQQALVRTGATAVQLGTSLTAGELAVMLEIATPRAAVVEGALWPAFAAACAQLGVTVPTIVVGDAPPDCAATPWDAALAVIAADAPLPRADAEAARDSGVMIYTSGTTGRPKGAHRAWRQTGIEAVADLIRQVGMRADERHLVVCPLYHTAAPGMVAMVMALGGATVLADGFEPEAVLAQLARERITSTLMVPTMLARLAALPVEVRARYDLSALRWVLAGAAPLPTDTAARFQAAFGPCLWNLYGSTEAGLVTLAGPADHGGRPGTIGRTLRGVEVVLRGADGAPVASGEVGELFARSATLVTGYHGDPAATAAATRDGAFTVGDLARQDADGYLYLVARTHDLIISGGVNIYPREIEDRLTLHPAIADAAVLGAPDDEWGERVVAVIVVRPGEVAPTLDDVRAWCGVTLAPYKRPRQLVVVANLPRNPTGKLDKRALRETIR